MTKKVKRYKDGDVRYSWKEGEYVVCPECKGIAVVRLSNEPFDYRHQRAFYSIKCLRCSYARRSEQDATYTMTINLNCPNCGKPIHRQQTGMKHTIDEVKVTCPTCKEQLTVKPRYDTYWGNYKGNSSRMKYESNFGLPYYFQTTIRGNLFWAANLSHINLMEQYIASDLRERIGMSTVARLPTFIKIKKNREPILKVLRKWKEEVKKYS